MRGTVLYVALIALGAACQRLDKAPPASETPPAADTAVRIKWRRLTVEATRVPCIATSLGLHHIRGAMNGAAQTFIRTATANIGNIRVDVGIRRLGIVLQKRNHGHDLAGLTVAALRNAFFNPRALHWMVIV